MASPGQARSAGAPSRRGILSWAVALPLAAVLLYLSLRGVDWARVWRIIVHAHLPYLLLGCASVLGSVFVRALRWRVVLNAEARFGVAPVFWAVSAGYLGNNFLPARAGEVLRSVMISRRSSLSTAYVLTTTIAERLLDVIALVLFSSAVLVGLDSTPRWIGDLSWTLAVGAAAGGLAMLVLPHVEAPVQRALCRLPVPPKWRDRIVHMAGQGFLGLRAFHDVRRFGIFALLTMVVWGMDAFGVIVGGRALGLEFSLPVAVLLLAGLGLGSALPSTPGYVGVYQFVAVTVLAPFGFDRDKAMAYILVAQALSYVVITACGLIGLAKYRAIQPDQPCARQ